MKIVHFFTCALFFLLLNSNINAQKSKLDSLQEAIDIMPDDTLKVLKMNQLAAMSIGINPKKTYTVANDALKLSEKINFKSGQALSQKTLGNSQYVQGEYQLAVEYYEKGLKIYEELGNADGASNCENNMGLIFAEQGNYEKSMKYMLKALKLREETNDKKGITKSLLNIGNIFLNQENTEEAIKYYERSLAIAKSINLDVEIANNYNNLGNSYKRQKKLEKSMNAYNESRKIFVQMKDTRGIMLSDFNLGDVYLQNQDYNKALESYEKALPVAQKINDQILLGLIYSSRGACYTNTKDFPKALENLQKGLNILETAGAKNDIAQTYGVFSDYYRSQGNYKEAYIYHKKFKNLKDSLFSDTQGKQLAKMRTAYDTEKKEKENELLRKENDLKDAQGQRKNIYIFAVLAVLGLTGVLAVVLFKNNKEKQKVNQLLQTQSKDIMTKNTALEQQKEEILTQRDAIDEQNTILQGKNEQIKASIRAAQIIQNTILPYEKRINTILSDYFIYYQPKDIVSGDLYWIDKENGKNIVALIDCTGHGVSGAMMTMIAYSILDRIVHAYKITDPAQILEKMHEEVKHALLQDETGNRDGMDIAIFTIDDTENSIENNHQNTRQITFAGAKRQLFYQKELNGEIEELKGQRRSIGGIQNENIHFENHVLDLKKGTMIYLSTDGYPDQNDVNRKKLTEERLKQFFEKISGMETSKQKELISSMIIKYMEKTEQRDDMLVLGVRV